MTATKSTKKGSFSKILATLWELSDADKQAATVIDRPEFVIRPAWWTKAVENDNNTAFAFQPDEGFLRRVTKAGNFAGVADLGKLSVAELTGPWQLLALERFIAKPKAKREPKVKRESTGGRRGRPPASEIAKQFPGWSSVADAAVMLGVSTDRLRRAVKAGLVRSRRESNVALVRPEDCRELVELKPAQVSAPAVTEQPAADGASIEVFS